MLPRNFSRTVLSVKNTHRLSSTAVLLMKMVLLTLEVPMVPFIAGTKEVNSVSFSKLIKVIALPSSATKETLSLVVKITRSQSTQLREVNSNSSDKLIARFFISLLPLMFSTTRLLSVMITEESLPSTWMEPTRLLSTPLIAMVNHGVLRSFKKPVLS